MEISYLSDWANLLFRWLHLIFGAAWIGTSFYFNWLNNHLREPDADDIPESVGGELWSVHGGYFYRVLKYKVAPEKLPKTLHWFKYEAYFTWVTGAMLLAVVYYLNADLYLVNPQTDLEPLQAIGISILTLSCGWLFYHFICKTSLVERRLLFGFLMYGLVVAVAFGLTRVFNPRAAYIHVGALLGTCMALNVFFVIIPNQKVMVDAMVAGEEPDAKKGRDGALRSLHNNYMTLPVLFIMVSNHFPMTFGHEFNWVVLALLGIIGVGTRHWFNLRGRGVRNTWLLPAAALGIVALAFVMSPYATALMRGPMEKREQPVSFSEAQQIILTRCVPCHAATPTQAGFVAPPKGLVFEDPAQIKAQSANIKSLAVDSWTMPLGNLTKMTEQERALLGQWIDEGAKLE